MDRQRAAPWIAFGLALAGAAAALLPAAAPRGFAVAAVGRLPVLEGGRVKPADTIARNALLMLRGKQSLPDGERRLGPDEWLLDVLFRPEVADRQPLFVIDDPEVLGLLGLEPGAERYHGFREIAPRLDALEREYAAAEPIDPKMPAPITAPIASMIRSPAPNARFSALGCSPSATSAAIGFREKSDAIVDAPYRDSMRIP